MAEKLGETIHGDPREFNSHVVFSSLTPNIHIEIVLTDLLTFTIKAFPQRDGFSNCYNLFPRLPINFVYTFLGNCPPTPPLNQHFALSEKCQCWLRGGVGGQFPRNV